MPFAFDFVPDQYIIRWLCDKVVFEDSFIVKFCHDKYETQKIYDKAVDSYLLALKLVPDWFLSNNMIEKPDNVLFYDNYIVLGDLDSDFVTFFINDIGPNGIFLFNINLNIKFKQCKALKKR